MCGIVGYLNLNGNNLDESENFLAGMCDSIKHRGPDETGMKTMGAVALGMTRLSIIDLKTGQQPITNEDGTVWIVFNGEIYNFQDLQKTLRTKGHHLATNSDTETIVHLYEEFGVDCLQYLEGMFSFAIWDGNKQRLFVARDRMGEKPLHWTINNGKFIFASEIKGIFAHPGPSKELNKLALRQYLALEYVPAPNTLFQDINKLLPAHYLIVENGQITIKNYWQPEIEPFTLSEIEAKSELLKRLSRSIELRLISDVPLGVFLSGGIDSSLIAALAARKVSGSLKTFSIGFADPSFDESVHAKAVAAHLGCQHENVTFLPELALETLHELWTKLDEPIGDAAIVPTYFLSKMTKKRVTVALAGEGGDELFGGYPTYQAHNLAAIWQHIPLFLRKNLIEPAVKSLPVSLNNLSFDYKVKRFVSQANEPLLARHLRWMGSISLSEQSKLLLNGKNGHDKVARHEESLFATPGFTRLLMPDFTNTTDAMDTAMRLDMSTYLPDDLLVKSDRASMAASLEVRLPFLAYPLVEFALSMPSNLKVRGTTSKYLLRRLAQSYLPKGIVQRPKKGFGIPVGKWLKHEFKSQVDELLNESFVQKQGLFSWSYIKGQLDDHERGSADRRKELWTLLMFQWWWRKFFIS